MMKLETIAAFVDVVEAGSITAAARRAGLAKSNVSDRLAELERCLGARLIQRSTRKLSLTENGSAFLVRARRLLNEAGAAMAEIAERRGELVGPLRLSAPVSFGTLHLGPALFSFLLANPRIELSLELDDRFVDAGADGFDAVIRHGPVRETGLSTRHLASSRRLLVASPAYLAARGTPTSTADLALHSAILYTNRGSDWRFGHGEGATVVRPRTAMRVNNGVMMRDAALADLGITLLPTFLIADEMRKGLLQAVRLELEAEGADVHVAYPRDRDVSAKVVAMIAHLGSVFGSPPYWEVDA